MTVQQYNSENTHERERNLLDQIFLVSPAPMALLRGPELVFDRVNPAYQKLLAERDLIGKPLEEAIPELKGQPFLSLMQEVFRTGKSFTAKEMMARIVRKPGGKPEDAYFDFSYSLIRDESGRPYGIHVQAIDITEKVEAIHQLQAREEDQRFRAELTDRMTHSPDAETVISTATSALAKKLGASRCFLSEIFDDIAQAVVHQDYAEGLPSLMGRHDLNGFGQKMLHSWRTSPVLSVEDVEADERTKDSAAAHLSLGIRSFISSGIFKNGKLVGVLNVTSDKARDWTAREMELLRSVSENIWVAFENSRLLLALKETESRFRNLADSMPQMVWVSLPDGTPVFYNRRWHEYADLPFSAQVERRWDPVIHPDDISTVMEKWNEVKDSGQDYEIEYRVRGKDGQFRWFLARAVAIRSGSGQIDRWYGTATNIHEQKRRAERQRFLSEVTATLSSSLDYEETLRKIAQSAVPLIADWCTIDLMDESGPRKAAVAHHDPSMISLAEEFQRKFPPDWSAPTGAPNVLRTGKSEIYPFIPDELLVKVARSEEHLAMIRSLGMRSAMVVPITARSRTFGVLSLISTAPDRTYGPEDLEYAEELGRRAGIAAENAHLFEQANRAIHLRDEFLSIASHELKTPVTSLQLQMQILARRIAKNDKQALEPASLIRFTDVSRRQIRQLSHLIDDMLDVSRIASGKLTYSMVELELSSLAKEVLAAHLDQIQEANISSEIEPGIKISGDAFRVEQVITNLLTNGIKYGAGKPLRLKLCKFNNKARLQVEDQGIGISPEFQEKIFHRFERAVSPTGITGLGLGLYITRQIVEAHGGTIQVESQLGQGSKFIVEFPLSSH